MKRLVPHDPLWAQIYENEARRIADLMDGAACRLHHIGSTAIPNLQAKPIIDILLEAVSLQAVDDCAERLEKWGYEARGEYGIPGRRYFKKDQRTRQSRSIFMPTSLARSRSKGILPFEIF